jgi:hypothetical protein
MSIIKHRGAFQMSKISSQIQNRQMSCTTTEAEEIGSFLNEVVTERLSEGRKRVIADIARHVEMKPSRVAKLMRMEIPRVWADEYRAVKSWHQEWRERQIAQLRHKAELLEAQTIARRDAQ